MATVAATRATCDRKHVGCVLVRDKMVLCTGYNGSVRGTPHCDDDGHLIEGGHCVMVVHAEANAVAHAARNRVRVDGATAYVTAFPCWPCFRLLVQAGVVRIVYLEAYRPDAKVTEVAKAVGVEIERVEGALTG
jgi:dCMP deaminase